MPSINFGIRLPAKLIERADARAELEDRTRSQVIRRAPEEHLAKPAPREAQLAGTSRQRVGHEQVS